MQYVDGCSRTMYLWKMSNELNLTYEIERVWTPNLQREGDSTLMDLLIHHKVSHDCLRIMNTCRMYLQIIFVSDMVSADGKTVLQWASHPKDTIQNRSSLHWRTQTRPTESMWKTWRYTILTVLQITTDYENTWRLRQPLGRWIHFDHHIKRHYQVHLTTGFLWDMPRNRVYKHTWHRNMFRHSFEHATPPISNMVPADGHTTRQGIQVRVDLRTPCDDQVPSIGTSTQQIINTYPSSVRTLLQGFDFTADDGGSIANALMTGNLIAACDGSVKGVEATFGYIFTDKRQTFEYKGYGRVPNTHHKPTSQRAEFYGAASVVLILSILYQRYNIKHRGKIHIYLDNKGVVEYQSQQCIQKGIKNHLASDNDLNIFIRSLLTTMDVDITWAWVKGHQDDIAERKNLSLEANLNIDADTTADLGYNLQTEPQQHLPGTRISVFLNGQYISSDSMRDSITYQEHADNIIQYLQTKHEWSDEIKETIDWDILDSIMQTRSTHDKTNIIKYIHGWQHTGHQKLLFNSKTKYSICTLCKQEEVQHHYMICPCSQWTTQRNKVWKLLKTKLTRAHTHPQIISIISQVIYHTHSPTIHRLYEGHEEDSPMAEAVREQDKIGWKHIFLGRISNGWSTIQETYVSQNPTTWRDEKYPIEAAMKRWRSTFILSLLQYGLDLWIERNNHVHGDTPKNRAFIKRRKLIERAQDLYTEGPSSVPQQQNRLFHNFEKRIEGSTRSLEGWIELVELAQKRQLENIKDEEKQPKIHQFFPFSIQPTETTQQRHRMSTNDHTHNDKRSKWAQQDLRRLFLRPNPNVPHQGISR